MISPVLKNLEESEVDSSGSVLFFVMGYGWFVGDEVPRLVFARVVLANDRSSAHAFGVAGVKTAMSLLCMANRQLEDRGEYVTQVVVTEVGALPVRLGGVQ